MVFVSSLAFRRLNLASRFQNWDLRTGPLAENVDRTSDVQLKNNRFEMAVARNEGKPHVARKKDQNGKGKSTALFHKATRKSQLEHLMEQMV